MRSCSSRIVYSAFICDQSPAENHAEQFEVEWQFNRDYKINLNAGFTICKKTHVWVSIIYQYCSRPQVSPGRTSSPMEYDAAYSPLGVQQQQSPQYQSNISPMMQMPSSSTTNTNLYSYAPEHARLQQAEPNLYVLGKTQEDMSHAADNQGQSELQSIELGKYTLILQNSLCNVALWKSRSIVYI